MSDVQQGIGGECTLDAALGSMAIEDPNFLQTTTIHLYARTQDGSLAYSVLFYDDNGLSYQTIVDDKLATVGGATIYDPAVVDPSNGKRILWASLIRKAYAVHQRGYANMGNAAGAATALLTGKIGQTYGWNDSLTPIPTNVSSALKNHLIVSAVSITSAAAARTQDSSIVSNDTYVCMPYQFQSYCVAMSHAYTVLSMSNTEVTLRNPWGINSPSSYTAGEGDDGRVTLPYSVYKLLFLLTVVEGTESAQSQS